MFSDASAVQYSASGVFISPLFIDIAAASFCLFPVIISKFISDYGSRAPRAFPLIIPLLASPATVIVLLEILHMFFRRCRERASSQTISIIISLREWCLHFRFSKCARLKHSAARHADTRIGIFCLDIEKRKLPRPRLDIITIFAWLLWFAPRDETLCIRLRRPYRPR